VEQLVSDWSSKKEDIDAGREKGNVPTGQITCQ